MLSLPFNATEVGHFTVSGLHKSRVPKWACNGNQRAQAGDMA